MRTSWYFSVTIATASRVWTIWKTLASGAPIIGAPAAALATQRVGPFRSSGLSAEEASLSRPRRARAALVKGTSPSGGSTIQSLRIWPFTRARPSPRSGYSLSAWSTGSVAALGWPWRARRDAS